MVCFVIVLPNFWRDSCLIVLQLSLPKAFRCSWGEPFRISPFLLAVMMLSSSYCSASPHSTWIRLPFLMTRRSSGSLSFLVSFRCCICLLCTCRLCAFPHMVGHSFVFFSGPMFQLILSCDDEFKEKALMDVLTLFKTNPRNIRIFSQIPLWQSLLTPLLQLVPVPPLSSHQDVVNQLILQIM